MKYLNYKRSDLAKLYPVMLERLGLIENLKLDRVKIENFISEVVDSYNLVPYHNFTHAFNITHQVYIILRKTKLREKFIEEVDALALLLSGIGHDLNHPGMNNVYYQKVGSVFSQTVNEQAVLENYHGYLLFHILFKDHNNFVESMSNNEKNRLKKATIECILGTDMSRHFQILTQFQDLVNRIGHGNFKKDATEDREVSYLSY